MADVKISGLPASTTPLAGTEVLPIVQGGVTDQVSVANLTAGRAVNALSVTTTADSTINTITVGKGSGAVTGSTALGYQAGYNNTTGSLTAVGYQACYTNTSGSGNSAFGTNALLLNTTGSWNTALGNSALYANTTGGGNNAIGSSDLALGSALIRNTTGNNNNAFGNGALTSNTTGGDNTAIGHQALLYNTTSNSNTAVGRGALLNTTGATNTAIGYQAGYGITSGANNVVVGSYQGSAAPISATGSNYVVLSDGAGNVRAYWNGSIGIFNGTISPVQAATASAPTYVKGAIYFDTTLNKLRVGGATAWETITSV
jgi:hypothetical protein